MSSISPDNNTTTGFQDNPKYEILPPGTAWKVIINPVAGNGKGLEIWEQVKALLIRHGFSFSFYITKGKGDATRSTMGFIKQRSRAFLVVGGDGTLNEVINGFFIQKEVPAESLCIGMIAAGTGNDWVRTHRLPAGIQELIARYGTGKTSRQDVGVAEFIGNDGNKATRYFINVAGLGFDSKVTLQVNVKKGKGTVGKAAYFSTIFSSLLRYRSVDAQIKLDDVPVFNEKLFSMNIGICRYSGGGMMQVPDAVPDDGLFDITLIRKISKLKVLINVKRLFDGSFVKLPQVSLHRCQSVSVTAKEELLLETDGESVGKAFAEFRIIPRALRFLS